MTYYDTETSRIDTEQLQELAERSQTSPQPAVRVLDVARSCGFTGEVEFEQSPKIHVYFDGGVAYYGEREGQAPLGRQLVEAGVVTTSDLERGAVRVGGVEHLGRLFDRAIDVDRDQVMVAVELATDDLLTFLASHVISPIIVTAYRHHASGVHRWFVPQVGQRPQARPIGEVPPVTGAMNDVLAGLPSSHSSIDEIRIEWDDEPTEEFSGSAVIDLDRELGRRVDDDLSIPELDTDVDVDAEHDAEHEAEFDDELDEPGHPDDQLFADAPEPGFAPPTLASPGLAPPSLDPHFDQPDVPVDESLDSDEDVDGYVDEVAAETALDEGYDNAEFDWDEDVELDGDIEVEAQADEDWDDDFEVSWPTEEDATPAALGSDLTVVNPLEDALRQPAAPGPTGDAPTPALDVPDDAPQVDHVDDVGAPPAAPELSMPKLVIPTTPAPEADVPDDVADAVRRAIGAIEAASGDQVAPAPTAAAPAIAPSLGQPVVPPAAPHTAAEDASSPSALESALAAAPAAAPVRPAPSAAPSTPAPAIAPATAAPSGGGFAPPTMEMRAEVIYARLAEEQARVSGQPSVVFVDDEPAEPVTKQERAGALRRLIGSLRSGK